MTRACAYLRAAARGDDSSRSKRTGERANGRTGTYYFQIQKQMMLSDRLGWDNIGVNDCGDKTV
jgi:hypothetical protein